MVEYLFPSESDRIEALHSYDILDTPPESTYDDLARLASIIFHAPIAVINFIDKSRQWFKAEVGLGVNETPLQTSFCVHALLQDDVLIVPDTTLDERFANNPLVTGDPKLRFYAGAVLKTPQGIPLGTLCILDYRPRLLDSQHSNTLKVLANQVMSQLEQRRLRKEAETTRDKLRRLNKQLLEQNESKNQFLAMVAHELRNPLSPMIMALDILDLQGPHSDVVTNGLGTFRRQTTQLVRLVDDLFDASRVASGKISVQRKPIPAHLAISRSVEMVKASANAKQHELKITLPDDSITLLADDVRICQLFSNLLNNAIRYTPPKGQIELHAFQPDENTLQIDIIDNGIGIHTDYLERIFESFVQAPQDNQDQGGLGIGLHLSNHIAAMHGGEIQVTSKGLNCGSCFSVLLPVIQTAESPH